MRSLSEVGIGPVAARARVLVKKVLGRGAQAVARGCARCASQILGRGATANTFMGGETYDARCISPPCY